MRAFILLTLFGAAIAAPKSDSRPPARETHSRVIGGTPTEITKYPFMSNVEYETWPGFWLHMCGGALLTTTKVLSCASCFYGDSHIVWNVRLGSAYTYLFGSLHWVSKLTHHEQYDPITKDYDIGLLTLYHPAYIWDTVNVASIPGPNYNLADGTSVIVLGYGATRTGGGRADELREATTAIVNHDLCVERYAALKSQPLYASWPDVTPRMLCTGILGTGGSDACELDEGGPIVHNNNVIVGLVSWRYVCADTYYPNVNTRVNSFTDWILANGNDDDN